MLLDAQAFLKNIETNYSKLNKEYAKNILKLLERISIGENLDLEMLKNKYLNTEEPAIINKIIFSNISSEENISEEHISSDITSDENNSSEITSDNTNDEIILDKITINNINYYYENKDNGRIFDVNSKVVGEYRNKIHYIFQT